MKALLTEILLVAATVCIPISFLLKFRYGKEWRTWEYGLIESWGINCFFYDLAKTALMIAVLVYVFVRRKRKLKKNNETPYIKFSKK